MENSYEEKKSGMHYIASAGKMMTAVVAIGLVQDNHMPKTNYLWDLLHHTPCGAPYIYDNANYVEVGKICERATGFSLQTLIENKIAKRLGLKFEYWNPCTGDGPVYCTEIALRIFMHALFVTKTLLLPKTVATMLNDTAKGESRMGLGVWKYEAGWGHDGWWPPNATMCTWNPVTDDIVIRFEVFPDSK